DERPGERLCSTGSRGDGKAHRRDGILWLAQELARVGDARIGSEARLEGRHPVKGGEGLFIASELDERVAEHRQRPRARRRKTPGAVGEAARLHESMARCGQARETGRGKWILWIEALGAPEGRSRARIEAGVPGFPRALLVREPEQDE